MINQVNAINAYKKIEELAGMKFPVMVSFRLFKLKNILKEYFDWQAGEERRIFDEYGASFKEDGTIEIKEESKINEFAAEINGLSQIEHEEFEKVSMPIEAFGELSMNDIGILSEVIEFTE